MISVLLRRLVLVHCVRRRKISLRFSILFIFVCHYVLLVGDWRPTHLQIQLGLCVGVDANSVDTRVIRRYVFVQVGGVVCSYLLLSSSTLNRFDWPSSRISVHSSSSRWRILILSARNLMLQQLMSSHPGLIKHGLSCMLVWCWVTDSCELLWCLSHLFCNYIYLNDRINIFEFSI